jgi:hypothetical protein
MSDRRLLKIGYTVCGASDGLDTGAAALIDEAVSAGAAPEDAGVIAEASAQFLCPTTP